MAHTSSIAAMADLFYIGRIVEKVMTGNIHSILLKVRYLRGERLDESHNRLIYNHSRRYLGGYDHIPRVLPIDFFLSFGMSRPTHIIRFLAEEDRQIHLGQLVDTTRDVGLDSLAGHKIQAYLIEGTVFDGVVKQDHVLTVRHLLSPITPDQCTYVRCLGLNYIDHAKESKMTIPAAPILFTKPRTSIGDPYPATIPVPKFAQDGTPDYEAELCLVIGKSGRDIPEEEALDYVLGYTCSNDVTARTAQMLTSQWCFGKGLDGSCPLGPVLVTREALGEGVEQNLGIKAILNGKVLQDANTKDMIFSIRKQISYLSQGTTLEAGSIILTGTPDGIGYFREPRVSLADGDDIRVWIDKIGTLVNKVAYEAR